MKIYKSLSSVFPAIVILLAAACVWAQPQVGQPSETLQDIFTGEPLNLAQHTKLRIGNAIAGWGDFAAVCVPGGGTQTGSSVALYFASAGGREGFAGLDANLVNLRSAVLGTAAIEIFTAPEFAGLYQSAGDVQTHAVGQSHAKLRDAGYLPLSSIGAAKLLPLWINAQSGTLAMVSSDGEVHQVIAPMNLHTAGGFFSLKRIQPDTKPILCRYWQAPQNQWIAITQLSNPQGSNLALLSPPQPNCPMELRLPDILPGQLLTEAAEMIVLTADKGGLAELSRDRDAKGIVYISWMDSEPGLILRSPYLGLVRGKLNVEGITYPVGVVNDSPLNSKPNSPHYWIVPDNSAYSLERVPQDNILRISVKSGKVNVLNEQKMLVRTVESGKAVVLGDVPLLAADKKNEAVVTGLPEISAAPQKLPEKRIQTYDKPEGEMAQAAVKNKYFNPLRSGLNFYTARIDKNGLMEEDDKFDEKEREAYFVIRTDPQAQGHQFRIEVTCEKYAGVLWGFNFTWPADSERQTIRFNPVSLREKIGEQHFLASLYFNGKLVSKRKFEADD